MAAGWKKGLKVLLLMLFLGAAVNGGNRLLSSKGAEYRYYTARAQHEGFYALKKDTLDVLFLGSSHCYCGFDPQELYDAYGIRSYNLGTSRQSVWISYYWLKEALRFQHPKAVVLDMLYVTNDSGDEASVRKALDDMRWGINKWNAVKTAAERYPEITPVSFFLPNIRYHERWEELSAQDFSPDSRTEQLKGYIPLWGGAAEEVFSPLELSGASTGEMAPGAREYLERMIALCREEEITLVLAKTPSTHWTAQEHLTIQKIAEENDLCFYDENLSELYAALGYDFSEDSYDYGHANLNGAQKITDQIGAYLTEELGLAPREDAQWERSRSYVEEVRENLRIRGITRSAAYLAFLRDHPRYTLLISVSASGDGALSPEAREELARLGLDGGRLNGSHSFTAVVKRDGTIRQCFDQGDCRIGELLCGGTVSAQISARGTDGQGESRILLDGESAMKTREGINLLVYDEEKRTAVDAVTLPFAGEELVRGKS